MFAEATKKAAGARFKKPQVDSEGQEIEVVKRQPWTFLCLNKKIPLLTTPPLFIQYDVREDEEQNVKLAECIDLLLAAGYFRARIKGLTPFDKVCLMSVAYFQTPSRCSTPMYMHTYNIHTKSYTSC